MLRASLLVLGLVAAVATTEGDTWQWDYSTAYRYVWYADAASRNTSIAVGNWTCDYCVGYAPAASFQPLLTVYNPLAQSYGYLGVNPAYEEIVLVFRGSTTWLNWLWDLESIKRTPYPYALNAGKVGIGFLKYWDSMRLQFLAHLDLLVGPLSRSPYKHYTIAVVGHSLGGACAALAGVDVARAHGSTNKVVVYTYGEPRVGDPTWVHYQTAMMGGAITRIVNNRDPVPHLPPRFGILHLFQHELREVWERPDPSQIHQNKQNFTICSATDPEDPSCSDSVTKDFVVAQHNQYMGVNCCNGPSFTSTATIGGLSEDETAVVMKHLSKWAGPDGDKDDVRKAISALEAFKKTKAKEL